jgi:hypothetical protein
MRDSQLGNSQAQDLKENSPGFKVSSHCQQVDEGVHLLFRSAIAVDKFLHE